MRPTRSRLIIIYLMFALANYFISQLLFMEIGALLVKRYTITRIIAYPYWYVIGCNSLASLRSSLFTFWQIKYFDTFRNHPHELIKSCYLLLKRWTYKECYTLLGSNTHNYPFEPHALTFMYWESVTFFL